MKRREFVAAAPLTVPAGLAFLRHDSVMAQGFVLRLLIRGAGGIGGLILSEVILGVLRAYGIDLAQMTEDFLRRLMRSDQSRGRRLSADPSEALNQLLDELERRARAGKLYPYISTQGACRDGGTAQLRADGCEFGPPHSALQLRCPGALFWAALRDSKRQEECMAHHQCGYPTSVFSRRPKKGYELMEQRFERGTARIVIDPAYGRDIEGIYRRNEGQEVWHPN